MTKLTNEKLSESMKAKIMAPFIERAAALNAELDEMTEVLDNCPGHNKCDCWEQVIRPLMLWYAAQEEHDRVLDVLNNL